MVSLPVCGFFAAIPASASEEVEDMSQQQYLAAALVAAVAVTQAVGQARDQVTDPAALAARLDLTGPGVQRWLEALGVVPGSVPAERLLVVNLEGVSLAKRDGGPASVHVDPQVDDLLLRRGTSAVLVHNHPANVGLSGPDLHHLPKPGVAAVVAIGHDGSVFLAAAGPRMDPRGFDRQYLVAVEEVRKRLRAEWPSGSVSTADSDAHFSHLVTLALARAEIVQYWFTLRSGRESYQKARLAFGRVVAGAAERLKRT
jgi:hypothetical protein